MRKVTIFIFTALLYNATHGQITTADLYNSKDYQALVKLEQKSDGLTAEELYMVGYAFFRLENDNKAIEFYDKAIAKGFDDGITHFYKGVSLTYLKKYEEALKEIDISLEKEPTNQEYMNQKGLIYKAKGHEDKALEYFEEATRYPNTYGEPFFWVAYIYHGKQDLEKALKLYYVAAEKVPPENSYYTATLQSIGQLEYTYTQNYPKSALAYAAAIALRPKDYGIYPKLIKAYNAAKEYLKAENIFNLMKAAYKNNELPKEETKFKNVAIDEYEWNKQRLRVFKSLEDPKNVLDISYKVFLFNKAGDTVERIFTIEKTIQVAGGQKHLLCEIMADSHLTYPYGWKTDTIPLEEIKKAIALVLEEKLQKTATSK
jgi:tetratricopeptide (TPR) repeat protein